LAVRNQKLKSLIFEESLTTGTQIWQISANLALRTNIYYYWNERERQREVVRGRERQREAERGRERT
jgi:hypothetical protein